MPFILSPPSHHTTHLFLSRDERILNTDNQKRGLRAIRREDRTEYRNERILIIRRMCLLSEMPT
jgi:hypothetical protein